MRRLPPKKSIENNMTYNTNILLVDGNSLFKRSYTGAKNLYNRNGEHIGGIYQFMTTLRKLLVEDVYHKVLVFWDGEYSGKLRYNIYPDYKANRNKDYQDGTKPIDESELLQKQQIKRYLEELFIRQIEDKFVESDDLISYICNTKNDGEKITICTSDRDFCQLLDVGVKIYMLDLKKYIDINNHCDFFTYHYTNTTLIKTLCGDSSDNIKGVKRLGEDTLLSLFPELKSNTLSLDYIISKAKELNDVRVSNKLKPLSVLTNIINGTTDGIQGDKLYEINDKIINLKKPLLTEDVIIVLDDLLNLDINPDDRGIKNVYILMKEDGVYDEISKYSDDYLLPFKKLINREKTIIN
jgi:5'-3' exonuclease